MSLKGEAYESVEEVKFRLENTVVTYDGAPVYITRVHFPENEDEKKEIARVYFCELPHNPGRNGKDVRKYLSSKKFDLAPFRMGYFNHDGEALFVSRIPNRQNKQGLSVGTSRIVDIKGRAPEKCNFNTMVASKGFVDMVAGNFPSFKEAGELLGQKENSSIAISRSFAFVIDHDLDVLVLKHKGISCGVAMKGDKALKLPPKYHFLREEAEQCRIPLA